MSRHRIENWTSIRSLGRWAWGCAFAAVLVAGGCETDAGSSPAQGDLGADKSAAAGDAQPDGARGQGRSDDPAPVDCWPGTVQVGDKCLPDGSLVHQVAVEKIKMRAPQGDTTLRVNYPLDVELTLKIASDGPVRVPVHVGLRTVDGDAECFVGGIEVMHHGGQASVTVKERLFVPSPCLGAASPALNPPVPGLFRKMVATVTIDPSNVVRQADDPQPAPTVDYTGHTFTVIEADGLDFELTAIDLPSSVVIRQRCIAAPPGSPGRCWNQGMTEDRDDADLHVQVTVEAFGVAGTDIAGNEVDVLGGKGLQLGYAIRPAGPAGDDAGWVPLWVRRRGSQALNQTAYFEGVMHTREPRYYGQPLSFDNGCDPDQPGCDVDATVAELFDTGAWADIDAFELRVCLSTTAESPDRTANNCRTRKVIVLRRERLPANPTAASTAYSGPGARNGVECPKNSSFCWSLKKGWNDAMNFGDSSTFKLGGGLNSFTRADLQQVVSKHDLLAEVSGFVSFELFKAYAYAAVYTDPDWFGDDPDKPADSSCECKVRNTKTFLDPNDACSGECKDPPECSKVKDKKKLKSCKKKCVQRCKNKCMKDNGKCRPACNDDKNACIGKCGSDKACKKNCGLAQKTCDGKCKKKVLGCSTSELSDADDCDCQAYYNYGIQIFGYKYWGKAKAAPLKYVYTISYSKEKSKEKTFLAGPVPINIGFKVEGELGVEFSVGLSATHGTEEPDLPKNLCATGTVTDQCGSKSLDGSCWCDFACSTYGDCCGDYVNVCAFGEPHLPVVKVNDVCKTALCKSVLKLSSYVVTLSGTVKPYATLDAEGWAGLGGALMRAIIKGQLNLFDVAVPFTLAGRMGMDGPPTSPTALHFVAETFLVLEASVLAGNVGLSVDIQWIEWCDDFIIPYPCGLKWKTIFGYKFAEWKGWEWKLDLWSAPLGSKTIDFLSANSPNCTTSVCTTNQ